MHFLELVCWMWCSSHAMSWKGGIIWNQVSLFDTIDGLLKSMGFLLTISMRFLGGGRKWANSSALGHMNTFVAQIIKVLIPMGPIRGNENGVSRFPTVVFLVQRSYFGRTTQRSGHDWSVAPQNEDLELRSAGGTVDVPLKMRGGMVPEPSSRWSLADFACQLS